MNTYWNLILKEVERRKKSKKIETSKLGTRYGWLEETRPAIYRKECTKPRQVERFYFKIEGGKLVYLTQRELDCVMHLMLGKTVAKTAESLGLSKRTVESYVINMKKKLACRTKLALLEKVKQSDLDLDV